MVQLPSSVAGPGVMKKPRFNGSCAIDPFHVVYVFSKIFETAPFEHPQLCLSTGAPWMNSRTRCEVT